jgi:hypothetical protein
VEGSDLSYGIDGHHRNMNSTAALNWTAPPHPPVNHAETPESAALSGTKVFLALGGLAFNTIQQRSGADEFPCPGSLSLARTSPLICAADILVAFATLIYGFWKRKGFRWSCALYVRNTRRHCTGTLPPLEMYGLMVDTVKSIPAILGALTIFFAKGIDIRIIVWASLFIAAPLISGIMRMGAEKRVAQADVEDFLLPAGSGKSLLQLFDVIWCAAYACQFTLWIQVSDVFSTLPRLALDNSKWMNIGISISISTAIALSALCNRRLYKYWSLQNWEQKQLFVALNVGFVLMLLVGMPTDADSIAKWRHAVFVPLGAFSVVVNMLWLVTLLEDVLAYLPGALQQGRWTGVAPREREGPIPDELEDRINPLLSTAPEFWRRTLMLNFACCQIFFAALNFIVIGNPSAGTLPSWVSNFGR